MKVEVTSWAPVPNTPTVSVDVKQHSTNSSQVLLSHTVTMDKNRAVFGGTREMTDCSFPLCR